MTDFLDQLGRNLDEAAQRLDEPARRRLPVLAVAAVVLLIAGAAIGIFAVDGGERAGRDEVAAPTATATAKPRRPVRTPPLVPVDVALARIDAHVEVPVGVPADLPAGTRAFEKVYLSNRDGVRRAQLSLRLPGKRASLTILYGAAGFDGCGPLHPRNVDVGGEPGVVSASGQGVYSTVVWPAQLPDTTGTYALSGPFSPREAVRLASTMQLSFETDVERAGC